MHMGEDKRNPAAQTHAGYALLYCCIK